MVKEVGRGLHEPTFSTTLNIIYINQVKNVARWNSSSLTWNLIRHCVFTCLVIWIVLPSSWNDFSFQTLLRLKTMWFWGPKPQISNQALIACCGIASNSWREQTGNKYFFFQDFHVMQVFREKHFSWDRIDFWIWLVGWWLKSWSCYCFTHWIS